MIANLAFVLFQVGVQVILAAGFATCLWWLLGRPSQAGGSGWIWLLLAGVAAPFFILQPLVYAGLPLRLTAWPIFGVALTAACFGVPAVVRTLRSDRQVRSDAGWCAALFVATLAIQSTSLITLGPSRYHGAGHYDQATYVVTAEFLVSEPYETTREEVGYRPWLLRALEMKPGRITGIVALGTVAVITGADSQQAYGAVNVFFIALLTLAVWGLGLACGLPRWSAVGAALLAGLAPAVTRIHLEGFFSQATSLFVFPALVGVLAGAGTSRWLRIVCAGILLAFLIGTYSELTPFGVMFVCVLHAVARAPWRSRVWDLMLILAMSLIVNGGYTVRLVDYLLNQVSAAQNPANLAALFPDSGTWAGWGRFFFDTGSDRTTGALGFIIMLLGLVGCVRLAARRQLALPAATLAAGLVLVYLRWESGFRPYVFAKMGMEFVGIWTVGVYAGLTLWPKEGKWGRRAGAALGGLLVLGATIATFEHQAKITSPTGRLALLSSERLANVRREAERNPHRAYLVSSNDPLVAEWLAYFGRRSQVVLDRRAFGDRIVTTEYNSCRRWTGRREELWWLDPDRSGPVPGYEPAPTFELEGALGITEGAVGRGYAIGERTDIILTAGSADQRREVWLDFVAVPLSPERALRLRIVDGAGNSISRRIDRAGWVRWPLTIGPGVNRYQLSVAYEDGTAVSPDGALLIKLPSVEVSGELPTVDGDVSRFL